MQQTRPLNTFEILFECLWQILIWNTGPSPTLTSTPSYPAKATPSSPPLPPTSLFAGFVSTPLLHPSPPLATKCPAKCRSLRTIFLSRRLTPRFPTSSLKTCSTSGRCSKATAKRCSPLFLQCILRQGLLPVDSQGEREENLGWAGRCARRHRRCSRRVQALFLRLDPPQVQRRGRY